MIRGATGSIARRSALRPGGCTRRPFGFTLVEMMIVVGIIGVLATLAVTSGSGAVRRQRFLDAVRETYRALAMARNGALAEGHPGIVQFASHRMTAFVDRSVPANFDFDPGVDKLLLQYPPAPKSYGSGVMAMATFSPVPSTSIRTAIFGAEGYSVDATGVMQAGEVRVTDNKLETDNTRVISVTAGGATRIEMP